MSRKLSLKKPNRFQVAVVDVEILMQHSCRMLLKEHDQGNDEWTYTLDVEEAHADVENRIESLRIETASKAVLLAFGGASNFRKRLEPSYKAARPRKPLGYREIERRLKQNHRWLSYPHLEADDVMGLEATVPEMVDKVVLVSSDKDMLTVPGWHYNMDEEKAVLHHVDAYAARLNHLVLGLTGDATDGYKGCQGVGEVTARKALEGHPTTDWDSITRALFQKAGHEPEYALTQMRLARVLQGTDYDPSSGEVRLWNWSDAASSRVRSRTSGKPASGTPSKTGSPNLKSGSRVVRRVRGRKS